MKTTHSTGGKATPTGDRPAATHRFVVVCLLLAVLAAAPGVMGRLGHVFDPATLHGAALISVQAALVEIQFGSGVRFWLGVGGGGAMVLLLVYPLRKAFAGRRILGSIAGWFKLHLIVGIFAPVAVLYHANFGLGGSNANVALWSMLAVAASGVVGHFVYRRASAQFYTEKQVARRHLDGALALLSGHGGAWLARDRMIERLEQFDAAQLAPRNGIRAHARARLAVSKDSRSLIHDAVTVVDQMAREARLSPLDHTETRERVAAHLHAYFKVAVRAANQSVKEQVWARWRLLHLPLFLVMCAATTLHVAAVWEMDESAPSVPAPIAPPPPTPTITARDRVASTTPSPIQQIRRTTIAVDLSISNDIGAAEDVNPPRRSARQTAAAPPSTIPRPQPPPASPLPDPPPAIAVVPSQRAADAATSELYEEVHKRTGTSGPRMALGSSRSLEDQIATYTALIRTREFKHSEAETGFALTGRHTRADCADCHKSPLKEMRSDSPRPCVTCHKQDDVHKGRRPACADCHTTNSFRDRKKRGR